MPRKAPVVDAGMDELKAQWAAAWPRALETWSRFVQLTPPRWCFTEDEEKHEMLSSSFAMIRLVDHTIVISLRQVRDLKLEAFALEVLAHEIGHHVYCPADLTDNARVLARIRAGLPSKEHLAPMISNLYTDLLINDRLQRSSSLNMAGVYQALNTTAQDQLWTLYMRIYEILWNLPRASLAKGTIDERLNMDAGLGARLIRSYSRDWIDGAGRFACLCLTYLIEDESKSAQKLAGQWHDTRSAGSGGTPDGLVEIEDGEAAGAIHPAEDPELSGVEMEAEKEAATSGATGATADNTGQKTLKRSRQPFEYAAVLKATGCTLTEEQIIAKYYRELAMPHLVKFPVKENPQATDPYPEGLEGWDISSPLEDVDWLGTLLASPMVVPGVTMRQRIYGGSPGSTPEFTPIDLYLGVDCSGSMPHPARSLSFPILAGAIIALSALRTGSRVMVALSGEPGKTITTDGFIRDELAILTTLTSYLGTGMTFGIHRLAETFAKRSPMERPAHILIVTDNDIFNMLDTTNDEGSGWMIAGKSLIEARGGGTYVLQLPPYLLASLAAMKVVDPNRERMKDQGWAVANVASMEELVDFARKFSQQEYGRPGQRGARV